MMELSWTGNLPSKDPDFKHSSHMLKNWNNQIGTEVKAIQSQRYASQLNIQTFQMPFAIWDYWPVGTSNCVQISTIWPKLLATMKRTGFGGLGTTDVGIIPFDGEKEKSRCFCYVCDKIHLIKCRFSVTKTGTNLFINYKYRLKYTQYIYINLHFLF